MRNVASYLSLLSRQRKIAGYMDIHAYSQLWMTPWGYTKYPTRDHDELVRKNELIYRGIHCSPLNFIISCLFFFVVSFFKQQRNAQK